MAKQSMWILGVSPFFQATKQHLSNRQTVKNEMEAAYLLLVVAFWWPVCGIIFFFNAIKLNSRLAWDCGCPLVMYCGAVCQRGQVVEEQTVGAAVCLVFFLWSCGIWESEAGVAMLELAKQCYMWGCRLLSDGTRFQMPPLPELRFYNFDAGIQESETRITASVLAFWNTRSSKSFINPCWLILCDD